MRALAMPMVAVVIIAAACSATADPEPETSAAIRPSVPEASTTVPPSPTTETVPPSLAEYETAVVTIGDRDLYAAIADTPALRPSGLMFVTDLGPLDGMLFVWAEEGRRSFWMYNTLIPLDIAWFDASGRFVRKTTMQPCTASDSADCRRYVANGASYAYEAPAGELSFVDDTTSLVLE